MEILSSNSKVIRFGVFEADLRAGELRKEGLRIKLQEKPFQLLAALLERPGEVVSREELREKLWPGDTFVDFDHGINIAVNKLREALGDAAESARYVETLARRGYRFIGAVDAVVSSNGQVGAIADSSASTPSPLPANVGHLSSEPLPSSLLPTRAALASHSRAGTIVLLVMVILVAGYGGWRIHAPRPHHGSGKIMLAVLPFENLSGNPEQDYFSDGLTEEMITQLGRMHPERLGVIARTTMMQYQGTKKSAAEIGRELGADYILEGSVRRAEDRVRITAQLIQV
ncbi:MAG: winged helix-turn-helix domain-containing protein, partial [Deltaproteobacteria bacterium]